MTASRPFFGEPDGDVADDSGSDDDDDSFSPVARDTGPSEGTDSALLTCCSDEIDADVGEGGVASVGDVGLAASVVMSVEGLIPSLFLEPFFASFPAEGLVVVVARIFVGVVDRDLDAEVDDDDDDDDDGPDPLLAEVLLGLGDGLRLADADDDDDVEEDEDAVVEDSVADDDVVRARGDGARSALLRDAIVDAVADDDGDGDGDGDLAKAGDGLVFPLCTGTLRAMPDAVLPLLPAAPNAGEGALRVRLA